MIQRRPTPKSIVSMVIVAVVLCFMARAAINDLRHILHRKQAIARVTNYKIPDPKRPTNYVIKTRFFNEYKHDTTDLNVELKHYYDSIPTRLTVYYDDKNEIYVHEQLRITWGTIIWKSLICLLLILYLAMELTTFTIGK